MTANWQLKLSPFQYILQINYISPICLQSLLYGKKESEFN